MPMFNNCLGLTYFNSYMVRLRAITRKTGLIKTNLFQFLHGAIKGTKSAGGKAVTIVFQFLHGAIKGKYYLNLHFQV